MWLANLSIFALAVFVGFEVISKVPVVLHTPLMSGSNAIHGVVLVGAMLIAAPSLAHLAAGVLEHPEQHPVDSIIAFFAVVLGTINVVGGFLVTDRMLEMFKKKPAAGGK